MKRKKTPRKTVLRREVLNSNPPKRLWWDQVTVAPLPRRIRVFKRGMWKGLKTIKEKGGHKTPISILGFKDLWKKVQKKEAKKQTSLKINNIILDFNPSCTKGLYSPPCPS